MAAIYLESIKPVMKEDGPAKTAALNTLYFCLDAALKMLSPTMPYLTEELYQRLPHIPAQMSKSICIAPFPEGCMSFEDAEKQMETLTFTCGKIRSQLASLNVPSNAKPTIMIQGASEDVYNMFVAEKSVIQANVRSGETIILKPGEKEPEGVLKGFVNESIFSFVKIEGAIDVKTEINRLEKRMGTLNGLFEG
jgi:valyl-tRNA synthetase